MDNTTIAQIDSGARIGVGSAGTLTVSATQNIIAVSLVQAGSEAGDIGFSGTVNWFNLVSTTQAQIADGVTVNAGLNDNSQPLQAGAVSVTANDSTILVGITGSAVKSEHIGFGLTFAVNNVQRTTQALIGNGSGAPGSSDNFDVASLTVQAANTGAIYGVAYAAAIAKANPEFDDDADPLDGLTLPRLFNEELPSGEAGVGAAGAAGVNVMIDTAQASINDTGTFNVAGGAVAVTAENNTYIVNVAGALAIASSTTSSATGVGGALGVNIVDDSTPAWIFGPETLTASTLTVSATDGDSIYSLSASAAGAFPSAVRAGTAPPRPGPYPLT